MDPKQAAREALDKLAPRLLDLSHRIHAHPELSFQEELASTWLCQELAAAGFEVERGVCGLPTAFVARAGKGALNVAFVAEYDALPGAGHACGHNVIAAAAAGAGLLLAPLAADLDLTVSVIGTPAEEGGGGKILMLEGGAFDGVHAALMVHPYPFELAETPTLAAQVFEVHYFGKEAHASAFPELGINAGDALTIAQVAIGLLRQRLRSTDRIHGIVSKGGDASNVIPAHTIGSYMARARTLEELAEVMEQARRCFEAGALATGARLEVRAEKPYAEMRQDPDLTRLYVANAAVLGREPGAMTPDLMKRAFSTDMGNVSQAIPSIHPGISLECFPDANHQPEFAAHAASAAGDRAVLDGALLLAWTAVDAATDAGLRRRLLGSASRSRRAR
ncbi:MAG TPA: M20 family metallopeptidase [Dehalococcoidia bacterium]|nr:M20 family metallopeptidase [Dehalococcoidia bacterium]